MKFCSFMWLSSANGVFEAIKQCEFAKALFANKYHTKCNKTHMCTYLSYPSISKEGYISNISILKGEMLQYSNEDFTSIDKFAPYSPCSTTVHNKITYMRVSRSIGCIHMLSIEMNNVLSTLQNRCIPILKGLKLHCATLRWWLFLTDFDILDPILKCQYLPLWRYKAKI